MDSPTDRDNLADFLSLEMTNDAQLVYQSAVDSVGWAAAFIIAVIYLHLFRRAAEAGGVPRANFVLGWCVIAWTGGGLVACMANFVLERSLGQQLLLKSAQVLQDVFALLWMIPVLSMWKDELRTTRYQGFFVALQTLIVLVTVALLIIHVQTVPGLGSLPLPAYRESYFRIAFIGLSFPPLVAGFIALRHRAFSPVTRLSLILMLLGAFLLTFALLLRNAFAQAPHSEAILNAVTVWGPLIIITGSILPFARFRFADRFIRQCVRIVLATTAGIVVATAALPIFSTPLRAALTLVNPGLAVILAGFLTTLLLLVYSRFETFLSLLVDRFVFPAPDYDDMVISFRQKLMGMDDESEMIADSCRFIIETLRMEKVEPLRLSREQCELLSIPFLNSPPTITLDSWKPECRGLPGIELLAPFRLQGENLDVLAIKLGPERQGLVTHEMGFIGSVASQLAGRIQALRHQRSQIESQARESRLQQQVTAAELQALRAQINPHFLFNALNTLADLIAVNPGNAESMTLRLAEVFRHVLAHSSRPMIAVHEEVDFLCSYLDIEHVRFGDRLQPSFAIDSAAEFLPIPSFILQPLVENALKHGLGPKPGPGYLRIEILVSGNNLHLIVEDDGMGLPPSFPNERTDAKPQGVGLDNIRRRLETHYQGQASLSLEACDPSGTRARIRLPILEYLL